MTIAEQEQLALQLYDCGAVKDKSKSPEGKGFRLKLHETQPDAPLSPIYLNLRTSDNPKPGPLTPEIVGTIGRLLYKMSKYDGFRYDCVAGVPNAGDLFAEAFVKAARADGQTVQLLKLQKVGGSDKREVVGIKEGEYRTGQYVLLIDDLVTRAHSKLEAIRALQLAGLCVEGVVVLVDRQQGGAKELEQAGFVLSALFTLDYLLGLYVHTQRMPRDVYLEILQYLATSS